MKEVKNIVSYGGGTNSTALLVGMVKTASAKQGFWKRIPRKVKKIIKRIRPDAILFADTGGEKPVTYEYIHELSLWLISRGFPAITIVRHKIKSGVFIPLESYLLDKKVLPPIAYGFKSCSEKYKIRPQRAYMRAAYPNAKINVFVGIDAGEPKRVRLSDDPKYTNVYKLVEWGWKREKCITEIASIGLKLPGKSSCFFCPNMRRHEILALPKDLQLRAIEMERAAAPNLSDLSGLGRSYKWEDIIKADEQQCKLFEGDEFTDAAPCECID